MEHYDLNGDGPPPSVGRKFYFRAYVLIKYGTRGAENKITIPVCVAEGVRNLYPDPTQYISNKVHIL